jgi:hypothetical protein
VSESEGKSSGSGNSACIRSLVVAQLTHTSHLISCPLVEKKAVPQHTYEGAGGERMYSSYSFTTSALDGVSGQRHAPAAFYPRGKDPRYLLDRRLSGPQSRSGHRGYRKNPFASVGDRTSIVQSSSPTDTILTELPGSLRYWTHRIVQCIVFTDVTPTELNVQFKCGIVTLPIIFRKIIIDTEVNSGRA